MGPAGPAPAVAASTKEEREAYVDARYHCMSDCDLCGLCQVFRGKDPMLAFIDYIRGDAEFSEVEARYRR